MWVGCEGMRPPRRGSDGRGPSASMKPLFLWSLLVLAVASSACPPPPEQPKWSMVATKLPSALLSVWGTSEHDVWTVGSDSGDGPLVMHFDGSAWTRLNTGVSGNLWWVFGFT